MVDVMFAGQIASVEQTMALPYARVNQASLGVHRIAGPSVWCQQNVNVINPALIRNVSILVQLEFVEQILSAE